MSKRRSNKSVKQMMVDVVKQEMIEASGNFSEREALVWFDGPCYICGGNFIWMSKGIISLTASELKGGDDKTNNARKNRGNIKRKRNLDSSSD